MNFLGTEMATIVKGVKVFGKGFAALGALVTLISFLSFAVLMDLVVTAQKTFHWRGLEITPPLLRPIPQIFVSLPTRRTILRCVVR
jgi:hypothetical protein